MSIDLIRRALQDRVTRRLWLISDLQQSRAEDATRCMVRAVADVQALDMPVDAICYMGDGVEGSSEAHLEAMVAMQLTELRRLSAPVYYVCGNHDFDYFREKGGATPRRWLAEAVNAEPGWQSTTLGDPFIHVDMGPMVLVLYGDHAADDGRWYTTHGCIRGDASAYPYDAAWYREKSVALSRFGKPVMTFSHYAFPGGQRSVPEDLHNAMLPLPACVRLHIYGHAHIGDPGWAGPNLHRKISCIEGQPINQVNISALEDNRGSGSRSAFLECYEDGSVGLYFRNHSEHRWEEHLFLEGLLNETR